MNAQIASDDPADVLSRLVACLAALDRLNAPLAAVHLSTAIETVRQQFGLPDETASTE